MSCLSQINHEVLERANSPIGRLAMIDQVVNLVQAEANFAHRVNLALYNKVLYDYVQAKIMLCRTKRQHRYGYIDGSKVQGAVQALLNARAEKERVKRAIFF